MATRRINGTLDTFSVDSGSEITYVGGSTTGDKSDDVRGFEVNPGGTGNIIVNLEKTSGIRNVQIFQIFKHSYLRKFGGTEFKGK